MLEKFPSGGPPPPSLGIFTFFTVLLKYFLPFYKPLNWKKQRKIWSGFGSVPSPLFGNFSHIMPFSDHVPKVHMTLNNFWRGLWLIVCSLDQDHGRRSCHEGSRHYLFKIDISPRKICLKSQFLQINEQMKPKTCFLHDIRSTVSTRSRRGGPSKELVREPEEVRERARQIDKKAET